LKADSEAGARNEIFFGEYVGMSRYFDIHKTNYDVRGGAELMRIAIPRRWRPVVAASLLATAGAVLLSFLSIGRPVQGASPLLQFLFFRPKGEIMSTAKSSHKIERVYVETFDDKVLRSEVPVLVDFYAEWCGPCRALAPVLEEMARENPNAKIVKVNVDESPELAARYRIESIPSVLVFRDSRLTGQHRGLADKALLRRLLYRKGYSS
jgi:thioredoxin 1